VFEAELEPVPGIVDALRKITLPTCVASSGSHDRMRFTLGRTGLLDGFRGRIFSVDDVENGKPAPDIFLHAAKEMGASPTRCAVVEDSPSGVNAGLAAGMTVFAYCGGVTSADSPSIEESVVFDDMAKLPALLTSE
jgi:HAD superfamily hydrolase (TIGR01509 family)